MQHLRTVISRCLEYARCKAISNCLVDSCHELEATVSYALRDISRHPSSNRERIEATPWVSRMHASLFIVSPSRIFTLFEHPTELK